VRYNPDTVKRIARILCNALTVLSLLLFLATVAMWMRSYWVTDRILHESAAGVAAVG
jgi:hypothetical protein